MRATLEAHGLALTALAWIGLSSCAGHHHGRHLAAIDWTREFTSFCHSDGRFEHTVLVRGEGPPVLLLHELPGLTNDTLDLALRLSRDGFKVYLPVLFGTPGEKASRRNFFRSCGGEFSCFDGESSGPVVGWIRDLSQEIHESEPGRPLAAIGMCLTGSIPLELLADPWVVAPVLSQPALPVKFGKGEIASSAAALECAKARALKILYFRFSEDKISPPERLCSLEKALPGLIDKDVICSQPSNPYGISEKAHSVLSSEYRPIEGHPTQQAYDKLVAHLRAMAKEAVPQSVPPACRSLR